MKKIVSLIMVLAIFACVITLSGCKVIPKFEDMELLTAPKLKVDISEMAANTAFFENLESGSSDQAELKSEILKLLYAIEAKEITIPNFTAEFSYESFENWEEARDYATEYTKISRLGSIEEYYLYCGYRILKGDTTLSELADTIKVMPTIAFDDYKNYVGTCTELLFRLGKGGRTNSKEGHVWKNTLHAYTSHKVWQAFIVML